MKSTFLLLLCLFAETRPGVSPFGVTSQTRQRSQRSTLLLAARDHEMEELISDLASSPSDEDRRQQLANVFRQRLGTTEDFVSRFEATLVERGQVVQAEARSAHEENQTDKPQEKELWAMVDMMVQSKVLIKQYNNEKKPD